MNVSRAGLNRIANPGLTLEEFFELSGSIGVRAVELRNDLEGIDIIDSLKPHTVRELASANGVSILTINALQKFNVPSLRAELMSELKELLALAQSIGCAAVVLCPNNDRGDTRDGQTVFRDTVDALKALSPLFEMARVYGYIEPLGFQECSLRSKRVAVDAIRRSGSTRFKILHDTFHHAIGPDDAKVIENDIEPGEIGLVHVSGVAAPLPPGGYRDGHRILVGMDDKMENREQVTLLEERGYTGYYSFEPFSPLVQTLSPSALAAEIKTSLANLG